MSRRIYRSAGPTAVIVAIAALASADGADASAISGQFKVEGSNGYMLSFSAGGRPGSREVEAIARRKGEGATYTTPRVERVTPRAIEFQVPGVADVDLHLQVRNRSIRKLSRCRLRTVRKGVLRGHVDFLGEEGFTEAHQKSVDGTIRTIGRLRDCSERSEPVNSGAIREPLARGAGRSLRRERTLPSLISCGPGQGVGFAAAADPLRPIGEPRSDRAVFLAAKVERSPRLSVFRIVFIDGPPSSFQPSRDLSRATLTPPAPFAGVGTYADGAHTGDLRVSLPGASDVPLAPVRASLDRNESDLPGCFPLQGVSR